MASNRQERASRRAPEEQYRRLRSGSGADVGRRASERCRKCGATNYGEEWYERQGRARPTELEYLNKTRPIAYEPEKGPLELRVNETLLEAASSDACDLGHMNYWFTEPRGGWEPEQQPIVPAEVLPVEFATARNQEEGRPSHRSLKPGHVLTGTVNQLHLYHGIKVDLGFDYDGLVPIEIDEWKDEVVAGNLTLGLQVQLVLEQPAAAAAALMHTATPDEWYCPKIIKEADADAILAQFGEDYATVRSSSKLLDQDRLENVFQEVAFMDTHGVAMAATPPDEDAQDTFEDNRNVIGIVF